MNDIFTSKVPLRFRGGKFRILCVSDIHGGVGYDEQRTVRDLSRLIQAAEPGLVLLLGDNAGPGTIHIENTAQLREMLDGLSSPMESRSIPWAHVYGNHDDNFGVDNKDAQKVYESYPHCVSKAGAESLPGCGNYVLPVYDEAGDKIIFAVYALDSHRGDDEFKLRYGLDPGTQTVLPDRGGIDSSERGVDFCQVQYYCRLSDELREREGKRVPALMVMHVPVQEFAFAARNPDECALKGEMGEEVSCQCLNAGLVRACIENGDVRAMCFGHDHENNCEAEYCSIHFAYDGHLSYHASHNKKTRGGRIYEISEESPCSIKTEFIRVKDL